MSNVSHTQIRGTAGNGISNGKDSHSTGANSGRWSTKRIAIYALFVALGIVASFIEFPLIPGIPFLKYDPSGIVVLVAGFAFGPSAAAIVGVLAMVPHLFIDPIGGAIAIVCLLALVLPAALIYKRIRDFKGALLGLAAGIVVAMAVALLCNWASVPLYYGGNMQAFVAAITASIIPFNLAKLAIHAVVTFAIYKPISNLLAKTNF